MTDDQNDPIIDSLLDEVLGGKNPPDLTDRILGAHRAISESMSDELTGSSNGKNQPQIIIADVPEKPSRREPRRHAANRYTGWAAAVVVLIGGGLFTIWALKQQQEFYQVNQPNFPPAATKQDSGTDKPADTDRQRALAENQPFDKYEGQEEVTVTPGWANPEIVKERLRNGRKAAMDVMPTDNIAAANIGDIETPNFVRLADPQEPLSDAQVVNSINNHLNEGWKKAGIKPVGSVGDLAWFHRATYAILGRDPTPEEKKRFAGSRDREEATEQLLASEEFSRHWAKQFTDVLVGAATSKKFDRTSLESFLAESMEQRKPLDQLAFELITAQGASKSELSSHNPAVNFLLAYQTPSDAKIAATDKVCQVFLGKQMQCVRCHDHPSNKVDQKTYWEVAAYFTQMRSEKGGAVLVDRDYAGAQGTTPDDADLFFNSQDMKGLVAYPKFAGNNEIKSGRIEEVNRRVELANAIVASDEFSQAAINRMWRQIFRSGFTTPVDDMGSHNEPTQAELLKNLASQFQRSEFDVRSALRWMLRSAAFDRKVRAKNDPLIARTGSDAFSSFASPESIIYKAIDKPMNQLAKAHRESRTFDPTSLLGNVHTSKTLTAEEAAKELQIVNGKHRQRLLSTNAGGVLQRLIKNRKLKNKDVVEHLFYSFVGRAPTKSEMESGLVILGKDRPKLDDLIEISQIILNSAEFKTQH